MVCLRVKWRRQSVRGSLQLSAPHCCGGWRHQSTTIRHYRRHIVVNLHHQPTCVRYNDSLRRQSTTACIRPLFLPMTAASGADIILANVQSLLRAKWAHEARERERERDDKQVGVVKMPSGDACLQLLQPCHCSQASVRQWYRRTDLCDAFLSEKNIHFTTFHRQHARWRRLQLNTGVFPLHKKCTNCNQLLSVKHILTECTSYDQARHQYYSFTDIKNIVDLTPSQNILNFIFLNQFIWSTIIFKQKPNQVILFQ